MRICSSFVLETLKGEVEIELLSKLNWWLFRGGWEPKSRVIVENIFWIISICFIVNWCPSLSLNVISCFRCFLSLKNQWKKGIVIFFWFIYFSYCFFNAFLAWGGSVWK